MLITKYLFTFCIFAERAGFEPAVPFWSTHTFQACSLNHSDTSPFSVSTFITKDEPKLQKKIQRTQKFFFLVKKS